MAKFLNEAFGLIIIALVIIGVSVICVTSIVMGERTKRSCYEALAAGAHVICESSIQLEFKGDGDK